jgi:hypothetical protein
VYRSAGARPNPSSAFTSLRLRRFDLHVPTSFPAYPAPSPLQDHASQPPAYAPAITLASQPFQLLSTRHFPRTAVRPRRCLATGGATQQLPVAAVTGPVLVVLAAEPSWLLSAQTASVRRSVQPGIQRSGVVAVVGNVRTPAMASVGPRPPCGVHHPVPSSGSGCPAVQRPAVWCPVRPVSSPADVRPSGVQPLVSTRPASSRLVSAPVRPDASVWSQLRRWRRATVITRTGRVPVGYRAVGRLVDGRGGLGAGDAAEFARRSVGSVADPAGLGAGGGGRA